MTKIQYIEKKFSPGSLKLIDHANGVIADYMAQRLTLTRSSSAGWWPREGL